MGMQRLTGECEMGLTESLTLGWVRVDQLGDIMGECVPVGNQLGFRGKLTNPGTDHVDTDYGTVRPAYQFDESASLENL